MDIATCIMPRRHKDDTEELFIKLSKDFHEIVTNKQLLRSSTEKFLSNLIDELTLGIIFDIHRKSKTKAFDLDGEPEDCEMESCADIEILSQYNIKKNQECICPKCSRAVAASRFATHLETCMGMGRTRSRNAVRRGITNNSKERENTSYSDVPSDDEDDADWSSGDKRRKKKKEKNGKKKTKGTPKKSNDSDSIDSSSVDIEIEDDLANLRDLLQYNSNSSSPADSNCSSNSGSGSKRKEKTKNKKSSKKDRSSPCSSISLD